MDRNEWPLWAQAKHAVRYPSLWTTEDLRSLVLKIKNERMGQCR